MNETPATKVLSQRRWFQLRLRTLLALVTLCSLLLGWISWEQERRRQEQTTIAWVEEMGGRQGFFHRLGLGWWERNWEVNTDKLFGDLLREIWLTETNVTDLSPLAELKNLEVLRVEETKVYDLSPLVELKSLKFIKLSNTLVSDPSPLAGLKNLTGLDLNETKVSDLSPLAGLKNLEWLYLGETEVSDLSPLAGLKNLVLLDLNETSVSDLSPLVGLKNLQSLNLQNLDRLYLEGTNVTEEQIDKLKLALSPGNQGE